MMMETISMNGRINYIDSAKGACMFLVVMVHTGVPEPLPNIYELDVPAFFVLWPLLCPPGPPFRREL